MKESISDYYREKGYCIVYIAINKEPRRVATLRKPDGKMTSMSYAKYLYTSYYKCNVAKGDQVDHINGDKMDSHSFKVSESGKAKPETIVFHTRKCKTATQSLNMNKDAYEYMTRGECPSFAKPKDWARMSKKQRLEAHLNNTVEQLGGISYTYQVFED